MIETGRSTCAVEPLARTALYVMQLFQTRLASCLNSLGLEYFPLSSLSCVRRGGADDESGEDACYRHGEPRASCSPPGRSLSRTLTVLRSIMFLMTLG